MKRYDCTKTEDFLEVGKSMCEGHKECYKCPLTLVYGCSANVYDISTARYSEMIENMQIYADEHLCRYPNREIELAKAVRVLHPKKKYIIQDRDNKVYAYCHKPILDEIAGWWRNNVSAEIGFSPEVLNSSTNAEAYTDNWKDSLIDIDEAIKQEADNGKI